MKEPLFVDVQVEETVFDLVPYEVSFEVPYVIWYESAYEEVVKIPYE